MAVGTLQAELRCSRRHLAARFAEEVGTTPKAYAQLVFAGVTTAIESLKGVGTTPKAYAQLVRFGHVARRLRAGQPPAAVAAACGYADQAHLTRHVRRFGSTTPAALRGSALAPVTSVQDAEAARA